MFSHTLFGAAALSLVCGAGFASTVSSVEIIDVAKGRPIGETAVVYSDTSTGGDVAVGAPVFTVAEQNADGTARVAATTLTALHAGGPQLRRAQASFVQTETNEFRSAQDYTLSFALAGQTAEVFGLNGENGFLPINPLPFSTPMSIGEAQTRSIYTAASFSFEVRVNGILEYDARADILVDPRLNTVGLGPEVRFDNVKGFNPTATERSFSGTDWITFTVDALTGDIPIGTFASGEKFEVTSILTAEAFSQGANYVGLFELPDLSQLGKLSGVANIPTPAPVPLPAAGWMLLAALCGLAATGRQKRA